MLDGGRRDVIRSVVYGARIARERAIAGGLRCPSVKPYETWRCNPIESASALTYRQQAG